MNRGSGVASFLMNYYRHIDRTKIQFDFAGDLYTDNTYEKEIEELGGKLYKLPFYKKHLPAYILHLSRLIKPEKYDIVHCHEFVLSLIPLIIAKKNGINVRISHSHIHSPKFQLFSKSKEMIVRFCHILFKIFSTDFFACSEDAAKFLFGEKSKFTIINNAIDTRKFIFNEDKRKKARMELHIPDNIKIAGYIARFDKQKNHIFLLDVFYRLLQKRDDVILLLAGGGEGLDEMRRIVKEKNMNKQVIFYGISNTVDFLYCAMDIFVFPSLAEGLGIVGVEAQCAGLPIVASTNIPRQMGVTDLVYWIDLADGAEKWAVIINDILARDLQRKDMSKTISEAGYSIVEETEKLTNIYNLLVKNVKKQPFALIKDKLCTNSPF
jgi:glycosyltransferase involved in cell wall biosynthesis